MSTIKVCATIATASPTIASQLPLLDLLNKYCLTVAIA